MICCARSRHLCKFRACRMAPRHNACVCICRETGVCLNLPLTQLQSRMNNAFSTTESLRSIEQHHSCGYVLQTPHFMLFLLSLPSSPSTSLFLSLHISYFVNMTLTSYYHSILDRKIIKKNWRWCVVRCSEGCSLWFLGWSGWFWTGSSQNSHPLLYLYL